MLTEQRNLNDLTVKLSSLQIGEIIDVFLRVEWKFSSLRVTSAYQQVEMPPVHKTKTVFLFNRGLFTFHFMSFTL